MAEPLNTVSPSTFTTAVLIGDPVAQTGGSPDCTPSLTEVNGVPVAAALEVQSTQGAILFPRMTTTERDALDSSTTATTDGMAIYNNTTDQFEFLQNSSWTSFTASPATVPGTTTNNAIVRWSGTTGAALANSGVLIDNSDNITGAETITLGTSNVSNGSVIFYNADSTATLTLRGNSGSDKTWILPTTDAAVGTPLVTDGAGQLSFSNTINLGTGSDVGIINFYNGVNEETLTLQSGVVTASYTLTLPIATFQPVNTGIAEFVPFSTNAAGALSFSQTGVCYASGDITSAEVIGMRGAPKVLLSAPGSGQVIIIHNFALELVAGATPFSSGGNVYLIYGGTDGNIATSTTAILATFIQGSSNQLIETPGFINGTSGLTTTSVANQSIRITNGTTGFAAGNGSLVYHIWYSIVSSA
jgi:hypothetical protein